MVPVRPKLLAAACAVATLSAPSVARANATPATSYPFTQTWSDPALIAANDDWSGLPSITGYLGDVDAAMPTDVDPRTRTDASPGAVDVIANQANPSTLVSGGVAEFDQLANPTVALQGSATADAPSLVVALDTTGRTNLNIAYKVRDVDGSADNAAQQVALQYRVGSSGSWIIGLVDQRHRRHQSLHRRRDERTFAGHAGHGRLRSASSRRREPGARSGPDPHHERTGRG